MSNSQVSKQWRLIQCSTMVELLFPNKTDALPFMDGGSKKPARYAKVMLAVSVVADAYLNEIVVGPLPISSATTWRPLDWTYTRKTSRGKVRNLLSDQGSLYGVWLAGIQDSVVNITNDLWGTDKGALVVWGTDPLMQDDPNGRIVRWDAFWHDSLDFFNTMTLLPLGLYVRSDVTGRDVSKWKVTGWFYNNIFYNSTEAFTKAYWSPGFQKLGGEYEGDWGRTDQIDAPLPRDNTPPPMGTTPTPARFAVDKEQLYAEWMGFSFYFGYSWDVGLSLYDIRYNGTRVLYELAMVGCITLELVLSICGTDTPCL
jgi:primary-amine oxidase